MERIVRQAREVGTSSGVLLPRKWLGKQVVVTLAFPSEKEIAEEAFRILLEKNLNKEIKGLYFAGSYARGEQDFDSDIDILAITGSTNKLVRHENYEILLVSEKSFQKKLPSSLLYLSMLRESKPILNKELLEEYKSGKTNFNYKEKVVEIKKVLAINKDAIKSCRELQKKVLDGIIYSLVLRLKELWLMKCISKEKAYSKKEFAKIIGSDAYSAYTRVKQERKEQKIISAQEAEKLIGLSEKWLGELRR